MHRRRLVIVLRQRPVTAHLVTTVHLTTAPPPIAAEAEVEVGTEAVVVADAPEAAGMAVAATAAR